MYWVPASVTSKILVLRIQRQSAMVLLLISWKEIGDVPALMEKEKGRDGRGKDLCFIDYKSKKTVLALD